MGYNLIVVEDEQMIRDKILQNINWKEYDFEKIFTASEGNEAIKIIEKEKVNIVITDIQMPGMDGLSLTNYIKENYPDIKIVIVTAHADFEYAMKSIKLHVDNYILKPFITKNLLKIILDVKEKLINEEKHKNEYKLLKKQVNENKKIFIEKLFVDLLNGNYIGDINRDLEYLEITEYKDLKYFVIILDIDEYVEGLNDNESKYIYNILLYEWIQHYFVNSDLKNYIINYKMNQIVVVLFEDSHDKVQEIENIIDKIKMDIGVTITIGLGNVYEELEEMYISLNEANSAVNLKCIYGKAKIYTFNDININNKTYSKILNLVHNNKLYMDLKVGVFKEIKNDILSIVQNIRESGLSVAAINTAINNIIILSCKSINEMGYNVYDVFGEQLDLNFDVRKLDSLSDLEEWFFGFFWMINEYVDSQRDNQNEILIMKVKEYIDENYNKNISLTSISKKFTISSSYLSTLFNTYIGKNFIDYITNIRLQKAKEYLKNSDLRINEISKEVGFRDPYYFSTVFKKNIGISPSEYRSNLSMLE